MDVLTAPYDEIWEVWDELTEEERRLVGERIGRETKAATEFYTESMKVAAAAITRFGREFNAAQAAARKSSR